MEGCERGANMRMTAVCASPCHKAAYEHRHWAVGGIATPSLPACQGVRMAGSVSYVDVYPVHLRTRKSFGLMTRKLSVTESRKLAQFLGTLSRKKSSVASAKCPHVA